MNSVESRLIALPKLEIDLKKEYNCILVYEGQQVGSFCFSVSKASFDTKNIQSIEYVMRNPIDMLATNTIITIRKYEP